MDTVGERVRALRESRGVTLKVLGEAIGMGISTLESKEKGRKFSNEEVLKIANYFSVPAESLLTGRSVARKELHAIGLAFETVNRLMEEHGEPEFKRIVQSVEAYRRGGGAKKPA